VSGLERARLGDVLEDLVADALRLLKDLGVIKDFKDLRPTVKEYAHKERVHEYPDFWVLLVNEQQVEIEAKNLGKRPKHYLMGKPNETRFWAYILPWVKDHMTKRWTAGAKKVLVVSSMSVFSPDATAYLRFNLDGIVEVADDQIEKPGKFDRDHIAVQLYNLFESWVK
jgi:hypothetical protein